MKRAATPGKSVSTSSSRRHRYRKVLDNRKHPIRGMWRRNTSFYARISVEDDNGTKEIKWAPLPKATSANQAQDEFRTLLVERAENRLRHIGRAPRLSKYIDLRLMAYSDARRNEALALKWSDVNLARISAASHRMGLKMIRYIRENPTMATLGSTKGANGRTGRSDSAIDVSHAGLRRH